MDVKVLLSQAAEGGSYLGRYLCAITRTPFDQAYKTELEAGEIQLSKELPLYHLDLIRITQSNLVELDAANESYVYYNGDHNIRLNIQDASDFDRGIVPKATPEIVKKAIDKFERSGGKRRTFFACHEQALEIVEDLNERTLQALQKRLSILMNRSRIYTRMNDEERARYRKTLQNVSSAEILAELTGVIQFKQIVNNEE